MPCKTCKHWQLKASPMAKHGLAPCSHEPRWEYLPAQHTCGRLESLPAEQIQARVVWFAKVAKLKELAYEPGC